MNASMEPEITLILRFKNSCVENYKSIKPFLRFPGRSQLLRMFLFSKKGEMISLLEKADVEKTTDVQILQRFL